jgi:hypothetical protein
VVEAQLNKIEIYKKNRLRIESVLFYHAASFVKLNVGSHAADIGRGETGGRAYGESLLR